MLKIAIPKGALLSDTMKYLAQYDIEFEYSDRKLLFETNNPDIQIITVRPKDVITFVERNAVDIGIVGSDVIAEYNPEILQLADLGYGGCRLGIAVKNDSPIQDVSDIRDYMRVATKFSRQTKEYFLAKGVQIDLVELNGAIEIAPLVGLSDVIVDLIGTGRTLRENGLRPVQIISEHTARLITNRNSWQTKSDQIKKFLK